MGDVTQLPEAIQLRDAKAVDELLPLGYKEWRAIAACKMAQESPDHTLQPTALVNEAWLRMTRSGKDRQEGHAHFFAVAAGAMRRTLVESARRERSLKRGGAEVREVLNEAPGDWIGRYRLLQRIGEGGVGIFFLADQEEPVRRRVALKVLKLGMDTRSVFARLEAQRP